MQDVRDDREEAGDQRVRQEGEDVVPPSRRQAEGCVLLSIIFRINDHKPICET